MVRRVHLDPEGFIDGGDQIVVPVHVQARAKNGKTMDVHNVWIYEFSEGKLIADGCTRTRPCCGTPSKASRPRKGYCGSA